MAKYEIENFYKSENELGEGPIWVEEHNSIYWVDIKKFQIYKIDISTKKLKSWKFNESISCLAHIKNNEFVAGTKSGFQFVDLDTNKLIKIFNPEKNIITNRFNDGKCDQKGNFYAGTMNDVDNKPTGKFYILDNYLKLKIFDSGYEVTNGPAFTLDYKKIYFTSTRERKIFISDLDFKGNMVNKRLFIKIPDEEGKPDGMTIDSRGNLWVALFGGGCLNCYNNKGKKINTIFLPVSCPTSCVFGGKNLDELYVTSASFRLTKKEKIEEKLAGNLFRIKMETKGLKTNKFVNLSK